MNFYLIVGIAALGGLLFGYDTGVISGALLFIRTDFALSAGMQGLVAGIALARCRGGGGLRGRSLRPVRPAHGHLLHRAHLHPRLSRRRLGAGGDDPASRATAGRRRHRRRLHADAALSGRDGAGPQPRRPGLPQPARHHRRHPGLLSHRLSLRPAWPMALDAGAGRGAGGDPLRRDADPAGNAALARRPWTHGGGRCRAAAAARVGRHRGRARRAAHRSLARGRLAELARAAEPHRPPPADHRRRPGDLSADHRHQHGHLFRADHLSGRRPLLRLGRHIGDGRASGSSMSP